MYRVGQTVRVIGGPQLNMSGVIVRMDDDAHASVSDGEEERRIHLSLLTPFILHEERQIHQSLLQGGVGKKTRILMEAEAFNFCAGKIGIDAHVRAFVNATGLMTAADVREAGRWRNNNSISQYKNYNDDKDDRAAA